MCLYVAETNSAAVAVEYSCSCCNFLNMFMTAIKYMENNTNNRNNETTYF